MEVHVILKRTPILDMLRCYFCKIWHWEAFIKVVKHKGRMRQTCMECHPNEIN